MTLLHSITARPLSAGYALGPITQPQCRGRWCAHRTAPVFITFGVFGVLALCEGCRVRQQRMHRARLSQIRRAP